MQATTKETLCIRLRERSDGPLRIVGYSDFFPNWPVFATPGLGREEAKALMQGIESFKA